MHHYPLAQLMEEEYNTLYPESSFSENSSSEYLSQIESRINELSTLLNDCSWGREEKEALLRELREARLTYYELKILAA